MFMMTSAVALFAGMIAKTFTSARAIPDNALYKAQFHAARNFSTASAGRTTWTN